MAPSSVKSQKCGIFSFGVILLLEIHQLSHSNVDASRSPVITNKALSSPSSISTMKNSAVWLHWNYTFDGAGYFDFTKQEWLVNVTTLSSTIVLAEKIGLNGLMTLASSLPSSLDGRVIVYPSNNTLGIKSLQYNDTLTLFQSVAVVRLLVNSDITRIDFVPLAVQIDVKGTPEYISTPSKNEEISENNLLSIATIFDGNPKPTAEVQWSDSSIKTQLMVNEEYPFIYKAQYSMNSVASSFCGKTLTLRAQNSVGKAADINITVTVLLSLNNPNLRAGKPNQSCVEVQWQKKESGLCNVTYTVNFKDQSGTVKYTNTEINKSGTTKCGIPSNVNITKVELQMSSTKRNVAFNVDVSENPIPPPTSAPSTKETFTRTVSKPTKSTSNTNANSNAKTNAKTNAPTATVKTQAPTVKPPTTGSQVGAIVGGTIGGLVALVLLVLLVLYCMKRGKRGSQDKSQFLQLNVKSADSTTVEQSKKDQISEP